MRLYLDDDSVAALLVKVLQRAGHDLIIPADIGLSGKADPLHLAEAAQRGRVLLTKNCNDFENLHVLVLAVQGHHPGILLVRQDNDPKRDLKPPGVVRALGRLIASGLPFRDQCHTLNHWR
jgi:predicted nuclease of predicted toxin-antitoxin system